MGTQQDVSSKKLNVYNRWAIIAGPSVKKTGLDDLVLISIQKIKGIELVERKHINQLLKEQALSVKQNSSSVSERVKLGSLLGADAFIQLSIKRNKGQSLLNVILSDCKLGARFWNETLPFDNKTKEKLAEEIAKLVLNVRYRFRSGISVVVGLSHFISKDFTHKHDVLQTRYAWLLGNALSSIPGVTVIEAEEAHAIGKELTLSQQTVGRRIVPLFIEGEYKVVKNKTKKSTINFDIFLKTGGKKKKIIRKHNLTLEEAGKFLSGELVKEIAKWVNKDTSLVYSSDDQIELLKERADRFALRGDWGHSTGLREAVLLLNLNTFDQRIKVIQEYNRLMTQDFNIVVREDSGFKQRKDNRTWEWIVGKRVYKYWNRALQHIEYLVINKQTTIPEITILTKYILHSICSVRTLNSDTLLEAEMIKKDFLRKVWPLVIKLDINTVNARKRRYYHEQWFKVFVDNTLRRCDGNYRLKEDLDLLYEVMEKLTPEDTIPSQKLVYFLYSGLTYTEENNKIYKKTSLARDYKIFLNKLTKSRRPINVVYGRYGLVCYDWIYKRQVYPELLQELQNIKKFFWTIKTHCQFDVLADKLTHANVCIKRELRNKKGPPQLTIKNKNPKTRPVWQNRKPANHKSMGCLKFEELHLDVLSLNKKKYSVKGKRWKNPGGFDLISRVLKCGDSLDVFWNQGVVLFMKKPGVLEEVFVDGESVFSDIVWDEKFLWIATRQDGIWIVKPNGQIKRKVLQSDGLPPVSSNIMLYAKKPGQVIAVGSFGNHSRAWCALISLTKNSKIECKVFHEATKVVQAGENSKELENNPKLCFKPHWLHKYNTGSNLSYLLVGRYTPS